MVTAPQTESRTQAAPRTAETARPPAHAADVRRANPVRQFRLLRVLRQESTSTTFEAHDLLTQAAIAVTLAKPAVTVLPARAEAWIETARRLARVNHSVLGRPRRVARHAGKPFVVTDLPTGERLCDRLRRRPLTPRDALEIAATLADAIEALHQAGLVHGRIRPRCVALDAAGNPTLDGVDFDQTYTPRAGIQGDLDALRAVTFEMLTGRHPVADTGHIETRTPNDASSQIRRWVPHLDRDVQQWLASVLEPARHGTPLTAAELATQLHALAARAARRPRGRSQSERLRRSLRRHRIVLAGATAVLLGTIFGLLHGMIRPGILELHVTPADATVRVNGQPVDVRDGKALLELADGLHWLRIEAPGWQRTAAPVQVDGGDRQTLSIRLLETMGTLQVDRQWAARGGALELSAPGGRRLAVTDLAKGAQVPVGHYQAWFAAANYEPQLLSVEVTGTKAAVIRPTPRPLRRHSLDIPGHQPQLAGAGRDVLALLSGRELRGVSSAGRTLWRVPLPAVSAVPAIVADLAGDGVEKVLVGLENGALLCLDALRGRPIFKRLLGGAVRGIVADADLNGDQLRDIIAGTSNGQVFAFSGRDGSLLWQTNIATDGAWSRCEVRPPIRLGRITIDNVDEVVLTTARPAGVAALSGRGGKLLWRHRLDGPFDAAWQAAMVTGTDGRGQQIVLTSTDGTLQSRRALDGTLQWSRTRDRFAPLPVVVVDDADGAPAVLWALRDGRLSGLDPISGRERRRPETPAQPVRWLAELAGGNALCAVSRNHGRILSRATARTQWTFSVEKPIRACRELGENGSVVALLCDDRAVLIHAPKTGEADSASTTPEGFTVSARWRRIEEALDRAKRP